MSPFSFQIIQLNNKFGKKHQTKYIVLLCRNVKYIKLVYYNVIRRSWKVVFTRRADTRHHRTNRIGAPEKDRRQREVSDMVSDS